MLVEQVILSGDCTSSIVQNSNTRSPGGKTIWIAEICSVMNAKEQAMHFEHTEFVEMKSDYCRLIANQGIFVLSVKLGIQLYVTIPLLSWLKGIHFTLELLLYRQLHIIVIIIVALKSQLNLIEIKLYHIIIFVNQKRIMFAITIA